MSPATAFWRVTWKEYRSQRGFWLGIAALAFALQALMVWLTPERDAQALALVLTSLVVWVPGCYGLGSAAVLFASEREDGTFRFLRNVAAPVLPTVGAKLLFVLTTAFAMQALLYAAAAALGGDATRGALARAVPDMLLVTAEMLAWGLLLSVHAGRVLNAVCFAVLAYGLSWVVIYGFLPMHAATGTRVGLLAVLWMLNVYVTQRWARTGLAGWSLPLDRLRRPRTAAALADRPEPVRAWRRTWKRLLWHERRGALLVWAAVLAALAVAAGLLGTVLFEPALLLIAPIPLVFGLLAFRREQDGERFRFLAHRGVSPQAVWLSKHAVWLPRALALPLLLVGLHFVLVGGDPRLRWFDTQLRTEPADVLAWLAWWVPVSYAVGQLASLLFRRMVVGLFVSVPIALACGVWLREMIVLGVPLLWSVGLIPVWLLAVTWWRADDWLAERRTWPARARLAGSLVLPPVLLVTAVAVYRVQEVPAASPDVMFPVEMRARSPDDRETERLIQQAWQQIVHLPRQPGGSEVPPERDIADGWQFATAEQKEWLALNEEPLALLLEATRRDWAVLRDPVEDPSPRRFSLDTLVRLLQYAARRLEAEGRHADALEHYLAALRLCRFSAVNAPRRDWEWTTTLSVQRQILNWMAGWANDPRQTPAAILSAVRRVEDELPRFPPLRDAVAVDYLAASHQLRNLPDEFIAGEMRQDSILDRIRSWVYLYGLPWERSRAERIVRLQFQQHSIEAVDLRHLDLAGFDLGEWHRALSRQQDADRTRERWLDASPYNNLVSWSDLEFTRQWFVSDLAGQRLALIRLVIIAFRQEHGRTPQALDELNGYYWTAVPLDPWSGRPFEYAPEGLPQPLVGWRPNDRFAAEFRRLPRGPLLWSVGPENLRLIPVEVTGNATVSVAYAFASRKGSRDYTPRIVPIPPAAGE